MLAHGGAAPNFLTFPGTYAVKHFITTLDWSRRELQEFLDQAKALKSDPIQPLLKDKSIALVFFNPSLRTRTSFDVGMSQLGGHAVVLQPGQGAWPMEFEIGATAVDQPFFAELIKRQHNASARPTDYRQLVDGHRDG